jgi:uncharacterized RDD family membrane protein YckC
VQETQTQAPATPLELEVERGPLTGQRLSLVGQLQVGSAEDGAANLNDPWLSPAHALFVPGPDGWVVQDLRSVEGTRVSGQPVRGAAALNPGDTIELGSTRLVVLREGWDSLDDAPVRRAERAAAEIQAENRRELDTRRVGAALLDLLLLGPVLKIVRDFGGHTLASTLAAVAVELSYFFLAESLTGRTLGKLLLGLRVVRRDGRPLTPQAVAARTLLRLIETNPLGLIVMVVSGRRRQRIGDFLGGTVVTRASFKPNLAAPRVRDRLALVGYPLMWLAPAVLLFALVPAARAKPCTEGAVNWSSPREGMCTSAGELEAYTPAGGLVTYTFVNAGHTLHMDGYDARLQATAIRGYDVDPDLASVGIGTRIVWVDVKVEVTNTGDRELGFGGIARGPQYIFASSSPTAPGGLFAVPSRDRSFDRPLAPGEVRRAWLRYELPTDLLTEKGPSNAAIGFIAVGNGSTGRDVGEIRLAHVANRQGARIVLPLSR